MRFFIRRFILGSNFAFPRTHVRLSSNRSDPQKEETPVEKQEEEPIKSEVMFTFFSDLYFLF